MGKGGVGEVFLARDLQLDRWVAIKRLHPETEEAARRAEAAMAEAKNLAALQHPNIVTIYDFLEEEGDVLVVMEYVQGRTLEAIVMSAPLMLEDFLEVALQSLEGLSAAHSIGMLHRDIKPSNIMITTPASGRMQVKILDFGLSKISKEPSPQTIDQSNALLGSIYTMAPEQFEQRPLDARTDLYALGCVLYQALSGRLPFDGETMAEVMAAHLNGAFSPLAPMRPDLSHAVCAWTERLMARNMEDRPRSASEASGLLRAIFGTTRSIPLARTATQEIIVPPAPAASGKRWVVSVVTGLLVLAAAGAALWVLNSGESEAVPAEAEASEEEVRQLPVVAPTAREELMGMVGREVTVEGVIGRFGESRKGDVRYLNFIGTGRNDVALVFFVPPGEGEFTAANLQRYVGRKVRVTGIISDYRGNPQMQVANLSQLLEVD